MDKYIIYNALITPDGTLLESRNRHDYRIYRDANGKEYMLDGGKDYVRSSANGDEVYLTVYSTSPHEEVRKYFEWGTFGKNGVGPFQLKKLKDLTTNHINAILDTQKHIAGSTREILERELNYREEEF